MVMRFTKVKEKIIKNKDINSTDKGKGRHCGAIRIGAFALVFVVLFSFVSSIIGYNVVTVNTWYGKKKLGDEDGYEIYKSKRENYKK